MTTSNEEILDRYIRHQTYLLRYAGGLRNQILPALASTEKKVQDLITAYVSRAPGRVLAGKAGVAWQREFAAALAELRSPAWAEMTTEVTSQLQELAIAEAAAGAAIIESAVPVVLNLTLPPAAQLISIVNSQPFEGRTLKQWMQRTAQADVQRMLTLAKIGVSQGLTPTQITRSVVGTKGQRYRDGVMRKAFRDVESVLLTTTNGIQQEAKQALYAANSDILESERYVNTLDARTTVKCIAAGEANDFGLGKGIYPLGKGPIPPLHFRCRSLRVPNVNAEALGNRPFDPTTEKQLLREFSKEANIGHVKSRDELPRGFKTKYDTFARKRKRELIGTVPAETTYGDWFKRQPNEYQNEVLGVTRAEMFRKGNISLDKFVDSTGDPLTLDELRKRE